MDVARQYAYVSGLGPHWFEQDSEPPAYFQSDYESESEREEREASESGNYNPTHACAWGEFCIHRVTS